MKTKPLARIASVRLRVRKPSAAAIFLAAILSTSSPAHAQGVQVSCANAPQNSPLSLQCESVEIAKDLKLTDEQQSHWTAYFDSYAKAIKTQISVRAKIVTLNNVRADFGPAEGSKEAKAKAEKLEIIEREIKGLADTANAQLRDSERLAKAFIETLSLEQTRYILEQNIRFPGIGETFQVNGV